jgi:acyl carrier protein
MFTANLTNDGESRERQVLPGGPAKRFSVERTVTISSRTPEGEPLRCPVCRKVDRLEPSFPGGDACCPNCGHLLQVLRDKIGAKLGLSPEELPLTNSLADVVGDSLDVVELVMELEEELDIDIPDDVAERTQTVEDALRYLFGIRDRPKENEGDST